MRQRVRFGKEQHVSAEYRGEVIMEEEKGNIRTSTNGKRKNKIM